MLSQKNENILNLALDASPREREKSMELNVGYDPKEKQWTLIVKYSGSLEVVKQIAVRVTELMNEYAVIVIGESRMEELVRLPQIEYVEKPKRLFFEVWNGKRVSCIHEVQNARFSLYGQGVLVAIIDSGIDYMGMDFRNPDGTTRIRSLWDQSLNPRIDGNEASPEGYGLGVEYTQDRINEAIQAQTQAERMRLVASRDTSGHGTAVAGIAVGVAPESELLIVKLGNLDREGFPRTTELMMGIDYVVRKALEYQMPVAINISFGYPSVTALMFLTKKYLKNPSNINQQFPHSIQPYL